MALPNTNAHRSRGCRDRRRTRGRLRWIQAGQRERRPERGRHHHVLARLERAQRGEGHPGQHRRVRGRAPEHPRQGGRQHHRRQDQPGVEGRRRQGPRRGLVVHDRQRRRVLHLARVRRPRHHSSRSPRSTPRPPSRSHCRTTPSSTASAALCPCSATRTASTTTRTPSRRQASPAPPKTSPSSRPTQSS